MTTGPVEKRYRFIEHFYDSGLEIEQQTFVVVKHTPKGVWISFSEFSDWRKFVLNEGRKRFAWPTLKEAMVSFIERKKKQADIYNVRSCRAIEAKEEAERLLQDL